ncbi:hypothetical protein [Winogradskyella sp. A3E31]|uniref:hypothetical protein n=1 Tax=Winogradskyella sp. A3E31 TaxID=3349637 RepID=UPI00398ACDE6
MKTITMALAMMISMASLAQSKAELKSHFEAYYQQMKSQGDIQGVINAMTHLEVLEPLQTRRDTLAYLYLSEGAYSQALNVVGIEKNAGDSDINVEVKALALKNLNQPKLAIEQYNVLYSRNPNPQLAYEIADLMVQTDDLTGAKTKIEYGLANVKDDMTRAFFERQQPYQTSLKAAFLYLKGIMTFKENQTANIDAALKHINEALAIDPNFNMAKISREALEAKKVQKN